MRPIKKMIPLSDVQEIINQKIRKVTEIEKVSLLQLNNRVLAENIISPFNVPPFDRAAMDGYAVKAEDIKDTSSDNPVLLQCIDKVYAGDKPKKKVLHGQCIEIATGAMLPEGADTVIQVEETKEMDNKIAILKSMNEKRNVSAAGADIMKGEIILPQGTLLTPGKIGVLASINRSICSVYRKPKIGIIPTGREIVSLGDNCNPGQIYDINSYTLHTMVNQAGGEPNLYPIIPDDYDPLERAILDAVEKNDLILIIGGSSVGERDINIDILSAHGTILFHGVKIKPGKPTIAAILKDKLVINLPGFPTSCLTNGYVLIYPIIQKMAHLYNDIRKIKAPLADRVKGTQDRDLLLTVFIKEGKVYQAFKESGAITSIAQADGYIIIPCDVPFVEKGIEVDVILF